MRFDDRLQTLLDAAIADPRDRAVRWRQLVDLVSRLDAADTGTALDRALDLIRSDALAIDEAVRAATIRAISGRKVMPRLMAILAAQPVHIAAPLFAGLRLGAQEATTILANADADVRALVTVDAPPPLADAVLEALPAPVPTDAAPSISEMVTRIERLKRARAQPAMPIRTAPPLPSTPAAPATPKLFEWESDASGHIAWVEGAPRGAFVGRALGGDGVGLLERQAAARIGQRHPFVDVPLVVDDALPGAWSATGVPAFDPATGRFLGYRGLARRTDAALGSTSGEPREPDLDSLRELVHEIKTPLNAIIGFAEIIDGQYLGPAHRRYRERAAVIVGQARQLLGAVEDLDFAAKLRAERRRGSAGSRLADLFLPIAAELERCLHDTGGVLDVDLDDQRLRCALSPDLAERLLRRFLLSLCEHVAPGEHFRIAVSRERAMCVLTLARPRALDGLTEAQLVDPAFDPRGEREGSAVGLGFALRLVRGLARVAGGELAIDEHRLTLELPALDH